MKAIVFHEHGGLDKLKLEEVPTPDVGPGEALVKVRACGVNHLDILVREQRTPVRIPMPHISGAEVAGEIAQVGSGVTGSKPGDGVVVAPYLHCGKCEYCLSGEETECLRGDILGLVSQGGYAEYVKVPASSLVPLPAGVGFNEAAAVALSMLTAWHMLVTRAQVKPGEDVLVLATGSGIGSAAIQIARLAGARVIATASTDEKLEKGRELGAQDLINYSEKDFLQEVKRITNRRGVDIVVEHIGAATWDKSVGCLARNGRLVTCGATTGSQGSLDIWTLFAKQTRIIGSYGGTRGELRTILNLVAQGKLRPVIYGAFPLEDVPRAQGIMAERAQFGKLIINPA